MLPIVHWENDVTVFCETGDLCGMRLSKNGRGRDARRLVVSHMMKLAWASHVVVVRGQQDPVKEQPRTVTGVLGNQRIRIQRVHAR